MDTSTKQHSGLLRSAIGLNSKEVTQMISELNQLLANYQIFYQNLRAFHWNIRGKFFFELHVKFEELYTDAALRIDEIAERILTLGGTPLHTYAGYLERSEVEAVKDVVDGEQAVRLLVQDFGKLLIPARQALRTSDEINDEGTNSLVSDIISVLEKKQLDVQCLAGLIVKY